MTEGTRSNLWVNMREAIATLQPKFVVWENVLGALSAPAESESDAAHSDMESATRLLGNTGGGHLRALGRVLGDLAEIGYDAKWTTLRASDIGAPHHRARIFLIAWPRVFNPGHDAGRTEHRQQHETPTSRVRKPSKNNVPDIAGGGRDYGQATHHGATNREVHPPHHNRDVAPDTGSVRQSTTGGHAITSAPEITEDNSSVGPLSDPVSIRQYGRGTAPEQTQGAHSAINRHSSGIEWGKYAPAVRRWERITRPAPAPTELNTRGKPRLNSEFAEWMMGLPAGWVTDPAIGLTRSQQLKALGNGVVPAQAAYALTQLLNQ